MSREPRCIEPGHFYHLISRFVDREWFIRGVDERALYLRLLGRALLESDWRCLAFAVMSNHIHLGAVAGTQPLDAWIRRVHAPFANAMNAAYNRIGPMFVRGPKDILVENERIGSVIAYIHNNPVRAEVVKHATASHWTSHRAYIGLERRPPWLNVDEGLARSGFTATNAREFDAWVEDPTRHEFDARYEELIRERPARPTHYRPSPAIAAAIVGVTASVVGLSVPQLLSRRRGELECTGRDVAVRSASRCGLRGAEIARALGISQQAVSLILGREPKGDAFTATQKVISRLAGLLSSETSRAASARSA